MDKTTGEIVASGTMITTSAFNITPPTYADGKIFVALAGSRVQAFDAETLESLWIFKSTTNGQPNSPITYHDGYVYTGFWTGDTKDCDYVCLSVEDENPDNPTEAKKATWQYMNTGGFYWAGCYVTDNYLLVGTDDGENGYTSQTSQLLSLDPLTGDVIDCVILEYNKRGSKDFAEFRVSRKLALNEDPWENVAERFPLKSRVIVECIGCYENNFVGKVEGQEELAAYCYYPKPGRISSITNEEFVVRVGGKYIGNVSKVDPVKRQLQVRVYDEVQTLGDNA